MSEPIGDPFIVLMERTLENLDHIHDAVMHGRLHRPGSQDVLFEVTQTINSFLGVLVMPWDRVFIQSKLNGTSNKPQELKRLGFPSLESSRPETDQAKVSLGAMLDSMRNGAAHGGITILGLWDFQRRVQDRPTPMVAQDHIAAIEIESKSDMGRGPRNWGCVLSVDEMIQFLRALHGLTQQQEYVRPEVWERHRSAQPLERRPS